MPPVKRGGKAVKDAQPSAEETLFQIAESLVESATEQAFSEWNEEHREYLKAQETADTLLDNLVHFSQLQVLIPECDPSQNWSPGFEPAPPIPDSWCSGMVRVIPNRDGMDRVTPALTTSAAKAKEEAERQALSDQTESSLKQITRSRMKLKKATEKEKKKAIQLFEQTPVEIVEVSPLPWHRPLTDAEKTQLKKLNSFVQQRKRENRRMKQRLKEQSNSEKESEKQKREKAEQEAREEQERREEEEQRAQKKTALLFEEQEPSEESSVTPVQQIVQEDKKRQKQRQRIKEDKRDPKQKFDQFMNRVEKKKSEETEQSKKSITKTPAKKVASLKSKKERKPAKVSHDKKPQRSEKAAVRSRKKRRSPLRKVEPMKKRKQELMEKRRVTDIPTKKRGRIQPINSDKMAVFHAVDRRMIETHNDPANDVLFKSQLHTDTVVDRIIKDNVDEKNQGEFWTVEKSGYQTMNFPNTTLVLQSSPQRTRDFSLLRKPDIIRTTELAKQILFDE